MREIGLIWGTDLGSFEYLFSHFIPEDIVILRILVNDKEISNLSQFIHRTKSKIIGQKLVTKLEELIPRGQFDIKIQAAIGGKIICRGDIKAYRKDVTAKCYGRDSTRKKKLLEKQKSGKKKMKYIGNISIPNSVFNDLVNL